MSNQARYQSSPRVVGMVKVQYYQWVPVTVGHNPPVPARTWVLALRTWVAFGSEDLGFKTSIFGSQNLGFGSQDLGFRTSIFGSQDLGFRTLIFGFQDLGFRTSIFGSQDLRHLTVIDRYSVLCFSRHFSLRPFFSASLFFASSGHKRTDRRTQQVTLLYTSGCP